MGGEMASLPIYDRSGQEVGRYEIDPTEIAPRISKQLLHDAVVMYQANLRLGTFRTKSRGEVAGTTKKMYRQKGTGNARAGSRRSGVRRGGGHIFAKRPRDFSYRLPKKAVRLATRMAIASKLRDDELVTTAEHDVNVYRSARNIEGVTVSPVADLNAWSVLRPRKLLMTKAALDAIRARAAKASA